MGTQIIIHTEDVSMEAELNDSPTAREIAEKLPIRGKVNRWGEEIYFAIPVDRELEPDARDQMQVGELGYWPSGKAFCIFFGPTPASDSENPVAASPVTVLGNVMDDATRFSKVKDGANIELRKK